MTTTTTHKTLRGPVGLILTDDEEIAKKLNSAVFPGLQGGPFWNTLLLPRLLLLKKRLILPLKNMAKMFIKSAAMADVFNQHQISVLSQVKPTIPSS